MRHCLFEFITGGGLSDQALPETLIREGEIMVQTLLNELADIAGSKISICRDSRLSMNKSNVEQIFIKGNIEGKLLEHLKESDVSWLIAPETDQCLSKYADLFIKHGGLFIGSSHEAIKTATSKYLTCNTLTNAGINVVETRMLADDAPESDAGWVIKPDDGVGAEDACFIENKNDLIEFIQKTESKNMIMQPYIDGEHMSMSLLAFNDDVRLLACNKQYIEIENGSIKLNAIGVNECLSFKDDMLNLAKDIIAAISGFAGYIGVDLIKKNDELFVLEINPRFTTAYAGISKSIHCNVADKILNTFLNKKVEDIEIDAAVPVRINV
jgi:tyramine---L-glutamate ligase